MEYSNFSIPLRLLERIEYVFQILKGKGFLPLIRYFLLISHTMRPHIKSHHEQVSGSRTLQPPKEIGIPEKRNLKIIVVFLKHHFVISFTFS